MSHNYIDQIGADQIEIITSYASDALSRQEFDRLRRFSSLAHAKGADIADRLTHLVRDGQSYRRPIFSLMDVEKPSVLTGFMEGLVPTRPIETEEDADQIQTVFKAINHTVASLVEYEPLSEHRPEAEAMLQAKLHTVVAMRSPVLAVAGVDLVLEEHELTDIEQNFFVPVKLPAVRLDLVPQTR